MVRVIITAILILVVAYLLFQIFLLSKENLRYLTGAANWHPVGQTSPASLEDEQNALNALHRFFRNFEGSTADSNKRLNDYAIIKISNVRVSNDSIKFQILFSIKPSSSSLSYWTRGNGTKSNDGWIRGKSATGQAILADEQYYVISLEVDPTTQIK